MEGLGSKEGGLQRVSMVWPPFVCTEPVWQKPSFEEGLQQKPSPETLDPVNLNNDCLFLSIHIFPLASKHYQQSRMR